MTSTQIPRLTLNNGLKMPIFGLGTWRSEKGKVFEAVDHALKLGYPHIDCAYVYQNEDEVGQALTKHFGQGLKREDIFITTKIWNTFHEPSRVKECLQNSLKNLQVSYVDLVLVHWPYSFKYGDELFPKKGEELDIIQVPLTETWKAMEELVKEGLTKSIGVSNFSIADLKEVLASATIKPVMNQIETHPYLQLDKLISYCKSQDIHITAYSPLGNPAWAATTGSDFPSLLENETIKKIADKYKKTTAQVLIRWQIERGIVVIPKSTTPSRIDENFNVWDFKFDSEDLAAVAELGKVNKRVVQPGFVTPGGWDRE